MQQTSTTKNRIESIDILRGIVMVLMALDHVRDYFHITANTDDPLNLATTTPLLYFTRWITHFCAPVFVFLSGTSIYLQSLRKTKNELSIFLVKRGLWLIFVEVIIISLAWTFLPTYNFIPFQVIWTIGISMVILGGVLQLPYKIILMMGLLIVFGHNLLDIPEAKPGFKAGFLWDLVHHGHFTMYPFAQNHFMVIVYPFLAWAGLMMLGYCTGVFFTSTYATEQRRKKLMRIGLGLIAFFIVVRLINMYGDPHPWSVQKNTLFTILSFLKIHKYPPSLLYLCITIGPALLLLPFLEKMNNRFTKRIIVFGRVPLFYYILHLYLIHFICAISFFARGHSMQDAIGGLNNHPFMFLVPGEGFGLAIVYLIWIGVVVLLYPLCKWYDRYKTNHKEKWWLSYL